MIKLLLLLLLLYKMILNIIDNLFIGTKLLKSK